MLKSKKRGTGIIKWSVLTSVCAILLIVVVIGTNLAYAGEQAVNIALKVTTYKIENSDDANVNTDYFKNDFNSNEELEANDKLVAEQLAGEGAVLLMNNDSTLPLKGNEKVSCFSHSSVAVVTCGTGSADIDTIKAPTLKKALSDKGFSVNTALWDFYESGAGKDYTRTPGKGMNGIGDRKMYHVNEVPVSAYSDTVKSSFAAFKDVAIVMISRISGEMFDMPLDGFVDGTNALELTQEEKDMFNMIEQSGFTKTIVLINSTNPVECDFLTEGRYGIDAALWIGYTGTYGLNAVADLLSGKINPSGNLVDTYCNDNTTSPAMVDFYGHTYTNAENGDTRWYTASLLDSDKYYNIYQEGIYVGYTYYETRYEDSVMGQGNTKGYSYSKDVAYPFGYGLSYTDFEWSNYKCDFNKAKDQFEISLIVKNTGSVAGKDVVQIYNQSPYTEYDKTNSIEKASVELSGFDKTELLAPGASETVSIIVPRSELAAYDYTNAETYILDAGTYYLTAAKDAHAAVNNCLAAKGYSTEDGMDANGNTAFTSQYVNDKLDTTTYSISSETGNEITNQFDNADLNNNGEKLIYLSRSDWEKTWPTVHSELEASEDILNQLYIYQTYKQAADSTAEMPTMGAENGLTLAMYMGIDYDDPAWNDLLDQLTFEEMATLIGKGYHNTSLVESVAKPATVDDNGPQGFTQTLTGVSTCHCAYSDENTMAATWNAELMEIVGKSMGNDMLDLGANGLYGPAMNTHRSAFSGRNFEYYSEDGFLAGKIAAAEVKGIQSKGVYVYIKHYALNDSETNCRCISIWANEQAIREIYLEPFKIAITEGNAHNVMNAFSRIGATWSGAHEGLMTEVLRNEWGMDGFAVTDFSGNALFATSGIIMKSFDVASGVIAGTDTWDSSAEQWTDDLNNLYKDDATVVQAMRTAAHRILYTTVNSNVMNGISANSKIIAVTPWWKTALLAIEVVLGVATLLCILMLIGKIRKKKAAAKVIVKGKAE